MINYNLIIVVSYIYFVYQILLLLVYCNGVILVI